MGIVILCCVLMSTGFTQGKWVSPEIREIIDLSKDDYLGFKMHSEADQSGYFVKLLLYCDRSKSGKRAVSAAVDFAELPKDG